MRPGQDEFKKYVHTYDCNVIMSRLSVQKYKMEKLVSTYLPIYYTTYLLPGMELTSIDPLVDKDESIRRYLPIFQYFIFCHNG